MTEKMSDWFKDLTQNRLAVTLIVLIIGGTLGFYVNTMVNTSTYELRLQAIETEIQSLKVRQGQIEMLVALKADKATFDECLRDLNRKMDRFNTETNKRFDRLFDLLLQQHQQRQ